MSLNAMQLGFVFSAKDAGATATMGRIERGFFGLQRSSQYAARNTGLSFLFIAQAVQRASTAMVRGLAAVAKVASDFEQAMANVKAVAEATPEEFARLTAAAKEAGLATKAGPIGAAEGLLVLAQAGFTVNDQIKTLLPTLTLMQASMGELTTEAAAGALQQALSGWNLSTDEAGITVDRFAQAANRFSIQFKQIPHAIGTMVGGAKSLQQSLEETLITWGIFSNTVGAKGAAKGWTGVNNLMIALSGRRGEKVEQGLGIKLFQDGKPKQMLDIVLEMSSAMDKMFAGGRKGEAATRWLSKTLNPTASRAFQVIADELAHGIRTLGGLKGKEAVEALRLAFSGLDAAAGGARGTARAIEDIIMNTFHGQGDLIKSALQSLFAEIGDPIVQAVKPYARFVLDFLRDLTERVKKLSPEVKQLIANIAIGVSGALAGFGALVSLRAGMALFGVSLQLVGLHTASITIAVIKLLAVLAPLALIGSALYVAWTRNIGGIQEKVAEFAEKARLLIGGVVQLLREGAFSGDVFRDINKSGMEGVKRFAINVYAVFFRIQRFLEGVWRGFANGIDIVWPQIEGAVGRVAAVFDRVAGAIFGASEAVGGVPSDRFVRFGEAVGLAGAKVVGWMADIVSWLIDKIPVALAWLQSKWAEYGPGITAAAQKIWGWIGKVKEIIENLIPIVILIAEGALPILVWAFGLLVTAVDAAITKLRNITADLKKNEDLWRITGYLVGIVAVGAFVALAVPLALVALKFVLIGLGIMIVVALFYLLYKVGEFLVTELIRELKMISDFFTETLPNAVIGAVAAIRQWLGGVADWFSNLVDVLIVKIASLVEALPEYLRPGFANNLVAEAGAARERISAYEAFEQKRIEQGLPFGAAPINQLPPIFGANLLPPEGPIHGPPRAELVDAEGRPRVDFAVVPPNLGPEAYPAAAAAAGGALPILSEDTVAQLVKGLQTALAGQPLAVNVPVMLDGDKIAEAAGRVERGRSLRGFGVGPGPAPSE